MRILLDEGYPSPPGFRPESIDATVEVVSLRSFDRQLTGSQTPDRYLYLRGGVPSRTRFESGVSSSRTSRRCAG